MPLLNVEAAPATVPTFLYTIRLLIPVLPTLDIGN